MKKSMKTQTERGFGFTVVSSIIRSKALMRGFLLIFTFLGFYLFAGKTFGQLNFVHSLDITATTPEGAAPSSVAVGDFNNDGKLDFVVAHSFAGADKLAIYFGNGDGTFSTPTYIDVDGSASFVATGDLNNDGFVDIALANEDSQAVTVLFGDGTGSFFLPMDFSPGAGYQPRALVIADFNLDGTNDIATVNIGNNTVTIMQGEFSETFTPINTYSVGNNPWYVIAADFNGDGKQDLAVANKDDNTVSILLGYGDGSFADPITMNTGAGTDPVSLAAVDYNNDGYLDLLVAKLTGNAVNILRNNKFAYFTPVSSISVNSPYHLVAYDFNNDGRKDFVVTDYTGSSVNFFRAITGGFDSALNVIAGTSPISIAVGDVDGDSVADVLVANNGSDDVSVIINQTPVAFDSKVSGLEDQDIPITLKATDISGATYTIVQNPVHGTLSGVAPNLVYTPNPDYYGVDSFKFMISAGGIDSVVGKVSIMVIPVNDPPPFTLSGTEVTVYEDAGQQIIENWAIGISKGQYENSQGLRFILSNDNPDLFQIQPYMSIVRGRLIFKPKKDAFGTATVTVTLKDTGGVENGGIDEVTDTFTITVLPVNDPPTIKIGPSVMVSEDCGPQVFTAWAKNISVGPDNEAGQNLNIIVTTDNDSLFETLPAVDPNTGDLTFTPAPDANGYAYVSVYAQDDGGTANGGNDTSPVRRFRITVRAVNDPPSFDVALSEIVLQAGDTGVKEYQVLENISAGPANESRQVVTFRIHSNSNWSIFARQPVVLPNGIIRFSGRGIPGDATIYIKAVDSGGIANGGNNTYLSPTPIVIRYE